MIETCLQYAGRIMAIALLGLSAVVANAADQQPAKQPPPVTEPNASPRPFAIRLPLPDYWLGIDASPVPAAMCSQLNLDGSHGLVVEHLVETGPAAKCGIKQYDIILSASGSDLRDLADLVQMLMVGKDREIEFQILRGGQQQAVKVKPEKRPAAKADEIAHHGTSDDRGNAMELLRQQLRKSGMPMRVQFFHPGILLPAGTPAAPIPDDLRLHIDKRGNEPAKIVVERGDKRWETTEDQLDKLPGDIRPHVEAVLGRMPVPKFNVEVDPEAAATPPGSAGSAEANQRLEKQLNDLHRRLDQMGEQLDDLRNDGDDAQRAE